MQEHKCNHENNITEMKADIKEMKDDIKGLLRFKWQIIGGFALMVFLVTSGIQLLKVV